MHKYFVGNTKSSHLPLDGSSDLIRLYPEISRLQSSGALLESKYVSDKLYQIYQLWNKPLKETLTSSLAHKYYLNYSGKHMTYVEAFITCKNICRNI